MTSASWPARLARCRFIGLPTKDVASVGLSIGVLISAGADRPGIRGGVVDRSLPSFGVDAADGVADLDGLRPAGPAPLFSGSAECWRFSCSLVNF
jgi:hypothetical protein